MLIKFCYVVFPTRFPNFQALFPAPSTVLSVLNTVDKWIDECTVLVDYHIIMLTKTFQAKSC